MKVVSSKQMAKIESEAILNGSIDVEFMDEAGLQIARLVHSFIERNDIVKQVVLLCGKGNNAGDAYVAGIHLLNMGYSVDALQLFTFKSCSPLCQFNQTKFFNAGGLVKEVLSLDDFALPLNGLVIDGIFGTGFSGEIEEPLASIIFKVNASNCPLIAIDIPSGLNGDTGVASYQTIVADETAFLGLPKVGFFLEDGWNHVGNLKYIDFGLPHKFIEQAKTDYVMLDASMMRPLMPHIERNRNKYEAGFVAGFAGSKGMPGAALLSSWSALGSGSGIVKLLFREEMQNELLNAPYELIKIAFQEKDHKFVLDHLNQATAVFVGPGIGKEAQTVKLLKKILPHLTKPAVIDADALNILSENKINLPEHVILTPHKGEMERLLGVKTKQKLDRAFLGACQAFAEINEVTLVLKGGPTFIFQKNQPIYINVTGDPGMATAGSGDVLTGLIASLLAQGLECHEAALLGTFLHGISGEIAAHDKTSYCMMASDLILYFPDAFRALM